MKVFMCCVLMALLVAYATSDDLKGVGMSDNAGMLQLDVATKGFPADLHVNIGVTTTYGVVVGIQAFNSKTGVYYCFVDDGTTTKIVALDATSTGTVLPISVTDFTGDTLANLEADFQTDYLYGIGASSAGSDQWMSIYRVEVFDSAALSPDIPFSYKSHAAVLALENMTSVVYGVSAFDFQRQIFYSIVIDGVNSGNIAYLVRYDVSGTPSLELWELLPFEPVSLQVDPKNGAVYVVTIEDSKFQTVELLKRISGEKIYGELDATYKFAANEDGVILFLDTFEAFGVDNGEKVEYVSFMTNTSATELAAIISEVEITRVPGNPTLFSETKATGTNGEENWLDSFFHYMAKCGPTPCGPNGVCNEFFYQYTCTCNGGFERDMAAPGGDNCDINIDDCVDGGDNQICQLSGDAGATCTDGVEAYTCHCTTGYRGDECEISIDECAELVPCMNGATCVDLIGAAMYRCDCFEGWNGDNCTDDIDECGTAPEYTCLNGGTCTNDPNGFPAVVNCTCPGTHIGDNCQFLAGSICVDEADGTDVCKNLGNCTGDDLLRTYVCDCVPGGIPTGYEGVNCTVDIDECVTLARVCTVGHGVGPLDGCVNTLGSSHCDCAAGYEGDLCETDINECAPITCQNGGTCNDLVDAWNCTCKPGWTGAYCQFDINECDPNPCNINNTDICLNYQGDVNYVCNCTAGYEGPTCDDTILQCAVLAIDCTPANGGVCRDITPGTDEDRPYPLNYECVCPAGILGANCQEDIDDCEQQKPNCNSGFCVDERDGFHCQCDLGWRGDDCSVNIPECDEWSIDCHNGTCVDGINDYTCACTPGYNERNCTHEIDECTEGPSVIDCVQGTCNNLINAWSCTCNSGFETSSTGVCDVNTDDCVVGSQYYSLCENNGVCTDGSQGNPATPNLSWCNCTDTGYFGDLCEDALNDNSNSGNSGDAVTSDSGAGGDESFIASGAGAGIIGGVVVILIAGVVGVYLFLQKKGQKKSSTSSGDFESQVSEHFLNLTSDATVGISSNGGAASGTEELSVFGTSSFNESAGVETADSIDDSSMNDSLGSSMSMGLDTAMEGEDMESSSDASSSSSSSGSGSSANTGTGVTGAETSEASI